MAAADKIPYFFDKYGNMILRLAFSYMKNLQDAEDAVQEVFLKLVQNDKGFENEAHEKAWFVRVTINICKNKLKIFWNRNTCSINDIAELSSSDSYNSNNTVLNAVLDLPVRQRTIIHLYYYEGYKTAEIAKLMGKRESSVRSELSRARQKLKIILKEDYDFE